MSSHYSTRKPSPSPDFPGDTEFKPIPGFSGYLAGDNGTVWSNKKRGEYREVIGSFDDGYRRVRLVSDDGREVKRHVARFVLMAFAGIPPVGMQACHNNGCKSDDRLSNLRWATAQENATDKVLHGTSRLRRLGPSPMSAIEVAQIREAFRRGTATTKRVAEWYGIHQRYVNDIIRHRTWKHVGGYVRPLQSGPRSEK